MDVGELILKYWLTFILSILSGYLTVKFNKLNQKYKVQQERWIATQNGVQALLRNEIIKTYNHYMEKGFIPIHERDNLNNLYKQYKNLGGNGTIPRLMEELEDLPIYEITIRMKGEKQ